MVTLNVSGDLKNHVQPGDFVITRLKGKPDEKVDYGIVALQKLASFINKICKKPIDGINASVVHIAQVVEVDKNNNKIFIAEAMPTRKNQLRIIDLINHKNYLNQENYDYEFYRIEDKELVEMMGKKIQRTAHKKEYTAHKKENVNNDEIKYENKFSFRSGMKSIFFSSSRDNMQAKKRIFKNIFDEILQANIITGGSKPRKLFCSSYIAHNLQGARALMAFQKLMSELDEEKAGEIQNELALLIEKTEQLPYRNATKLVSAWASKMALEHGDKIMPADLHGIDDSRYFSPAKFAHYLKNHAVGIAILTKKTCNDR